MDKNTEGKQPYLIWSLTSSGDIWQENPRRRGNLECSFDSFGEGDDPG